MSKTLVADRMGLIDASGIRKVFALAAELKKHPQDFPEIFYRVQPEAFKKWALLYLEPKQLQEIKAKLREHQPLLTALATQPSLTRFFQGVNRLCVPILWRSRAMRLERG